MKTKLQYFWSTLQSSFWFIPLMLILAAMVAAVALVYVDEVWDFEPEGVFRFLLVGSADSARSILSTIAGAMIGVAGTVFSITLVALTLASSQFGPRLLQNFMHDRINQVVLGSYIATFTYCLIVLSTVKSSDSFNFLPVLAISFALFLAVVNIFLLVIFIHHIAVNIQADQVISKVNMALNQNFTKLFPEITDGSFEQEKDHDSHIQKLKEVSGKYSIKIRKSGYVQHIDYKTLIAIAKENNIFLEIRTHAGHFLVEGQVVIEAYLRGDMVDKWEDKVTDAIIVGPKRTSLQDAEFAIRQMVEVASRALSPGVNDPFTAITVIDKLTDSIAYLTRAQMPGAYRYDDRGQLRLIVKTMSFSGIVSIAFNQIRQFGQGSPAVLIRLMEAMLTIHSLCRTEDQKQVVLLHARMIHEAAKRNFGEPRDLADLEDRYASICPID